jgi:hypothetical protein
MINSHPSTARTELQDHHRNNSRGVISNTTVPTGTFGAQYPLSAALKIPVIDAGPGFDVLGPRPRSKPQFQLMEFKRSA